MGTRQELQSKFEDLLGSSNVYYNPPEGLKMEYTAIRYSKTKPNIKRADNKIYNMNNCYEVTVISRRPDDPVIQKILELPYCSYDRHYIADKLHHDTMTLYF